MDSIAPTTLQPHACVRASTVSAVLGALVGLACASTPGKPSELREHFLTGKDGWYPQDRYTTGAGQGRDASQARVTAFADIGAQMQSRIEATLVSHEHAMTGPAGSTTVSQVTNHVRQHTVFDHHGLAKVVDTQIKDGVVYAFAVLDRRALAEPFLRDAATAGTLLRRALQELAAAQAKMDLRGAARLAKEADKQARELASALVLIESMSIATPMEGDWDDVAKAAQIEAELRRIRSKALVEVCLTPARDFPEASQLLQAIVDHLVSLGLSAVACGKGNGGAAFRAQGDIGAVFSTEAALGGAVFCRPSVDLRMINLKDGSEVLSASLGGDAARAVGRDREVATRAALNKLSALCLPRLSEAFGVEP